MYALTTGSIVNLIYQQVACARASFQPRTNAFVLSELKKPYHGFWNRCHEQFR
jgi:hypothetical protein